MNSLIQIILHIKLADFDNLGTLRTWDINGIPNHLDPSSTNLTILNKNGT